MTITLEEARSLMNKHNSHHIIGWSSVYDGSHYVLAALPWTDLSELVLENVKKNHPEAWFFYDGVTNTLKTAESVRHRCSFPKEAKDDKPMIGYVYTHQYKQLGEGPWINEKNFINGNLALSSVIKNAEDCLKDNPQRIIRYDGGVVTVIRPELIKKSRCLNGCGKEKE